jgi:hypothetical protein
VFGGDAQVFVAEYLSKPVDGMYAFRRIPYHPSTYAIKFHSKLYGIAEERQKVQQVELFGGQKHQVLVTPDGWKWTMPPPKDQPQQ